MTYVFQSARFELEQQIRRHAHYISGRVLDVGSGSRPRYRGFFADCSEYVKLDIPGVSDVDVVGSADAIPLPDGSFDSIITTQVIGDLYDVRKVFGEFNRVLKHGGRLLLTEAFMDPLHDEPHDFWRFTSHSLRKLAEEAGFRIEFIESRGGLRSVRAQFLIRYFIERFKVYKRWYRRLFSVWAQFYGRYAIWSDGRDTSDANKLFAHGFILIARKER